MPGAAAGRGLRGHGAEHQARVARPETVARRGLGRRRGRSARRLDLAFQIPGTSFTVAPSGGLGLAPYARHRALGTSTFPQPAQPLTTASGGIWNLGLALRWRRLVLEQHIVVPFGAEEAISVNKEYYPITLGWRF